MQDVLLKAGLITHNDVARVTKEEEEQEKQRLLEEAHLATEKFEAEEKARQERKRIARIRERAAEVAASDNPGDKRRRHFAHQAYAPRSKNFQPN